MADKQRYEDEKASYNVREGCSFELPNAVHDGMAMHHYQ